MKKKRLIKGICIVILGIILCFFIRRGYYYLGDLVIIEKDYYDGQEKELWYPTDPFDIPIILDIMHTANEAFSTIGERTPELKEKFGKLVYYIEDSPEAAKREYKLTFITGNFTDKSGYIWAKYSTETYGADESLVSGSWWIQVRWYFEKINNRWIITHIYEHP